MTRHSITLNTPAGERRFDCDDDTAILDCAENNGVDDLPWGCRAGVCGSCVAQLVDGKVEQEEQMALDDRRVDEGFVVLCSARPLADCVIDTHKRDEL